MRRVPRQAEQPLSPTTVYLETGENMKLYLTNINEITMEHMPLISPERAKKASRYRFPADKKRCIAGGLLLRRFLGDNAIFTDEFGKPRAESGVCFNLSHSGDWVMLAVGEKEIGCDIEQLRQTDALRMGRVVYTDAELELLRGSRDRLGCFYALWTKKEALLKCMGKGFHRAAKSVDVCADRFCEDGFTYHMQTKAFADYTLSVCVRCGAADTETELVHFPLL